MLVSNTASTTAQRPTGMFSQSPVGIDLSHPRKPEKKAVRATAYSSHPAFLRKGAHAGHPLLFVALLSSFVIVSYLLKLFSIILSLLDNILYLCNRKREIPATEEDTRGPESEPLPTHPTNHPWQR